MSEQLPNEQRFAVRVHEPKNGAGGLLFTFVPKGARLPYHAGKPPARAPKYMVRAVGSEDGVSFDWGETLDDPGAAKAHLEEVVRRRVSERRAWVGLVADLVERVEQWCKELGWSTRRIEKEVDDSRIGKHKAPALLVQDETVRVLLEPVAPFVPGGEGLVELSLMPAYDDIASLYYREGAWHAHYIFPGSAPVATVRAAEPMPLSKDVLGSVLGAMKRHG